MPSETEAAEFASLSTSFYELLNLESTAPAKDVRRAYRKTALQYHPDKNPDNPSAVEKFHLLTAAQEILCDVALRAAYDNALSAKAAKRKRTEAYDNNRRQMKEELEARENTAKRVKTELDEKKREFERLKEEGARRRMEMDEKKKKAAEEEEREEMERNMEDVAVDDEVAVAGTSKYTELDRTVTVKWRRKGVGEMMDRDGVMDLFGRFGPIEECVLRSGSKDKEKKYGTALLIFRSIVHAHAAVNMDRKALENEDDEWSIFRDTTWTSGKEPDLTFTKAAKPKPKPEEESLRDKKPSANPNDKFPSTSTYKPPGNAPTFNSFKTPSTTKAATEESTSMADDDDYEAATLMKMKAMAKKRKEEREKQKAEASRREAEGDKAE